MTAPELKPCPFCGGRNVGWEWVSTYSTDSSYAFFGCLDCRIGSNEADEDNTMHPADVSAWNTRAPDPDLEAHIGAVLAEAANTCGKNNGPWRSSAWECREAILSLHPTTLTALDRAIEAAVNEALERAAREAENGWLYQYETAPDRIRAMKKGEKK